MSPGAYTFSSVLNFSSNHTIGSLIAEIPVLAAGLLAFAAALFCVVLKKLDLAIGFITAAALLDFFAGIVDVSQIILRGSADGASDNTIQALMNVRDVFFSLAAGSRFLSFWAIVAQCPRGEICPTNRYPPNTSQTFLSFDSSVHSGSWIRWGVVGIFLKWGTVAVAVAIALLQILWRTITAFDNGGAVYVIENGLEIVVSVVFIIKMLLNSAIVESTSSWKALLQYTPIIFALAINIGLGIGNLSYFAFSESTTGRLLLAIELYIVIETLLIWKFCPAPVDDSNGGDVSNEKRRASSFRGLRTSQTNPMPLLPSSEDPAPRIPSLARLSVQGRRLSSWMIRTTSGLSGRYRPALERDEARLFNPQDLERGRTPSPVGTDQGVVTVDRSPTEPKQSARYPDPVFTSFFIDSQRGENSFATSGTSMPESPGKKHESLGASTLPSYYIGAQDSQSVLAPPPAVLNPDSPIFGLNGTLRGGRFSPVTSNHGVSSPAPLADRPSSAQFAKPLMSPPSFPDGAVNSARSSGYEQLLREQSELEKSIAQLRMFASSTDDDLRASVLGDGSGSGSGQRTTVTSFSNGMPPSASVKSEFSLSNFPEPPLARRSSQARRSILHDPNTQTTLDRDLVREDRISDEIDLAPPRMPAARDDVPSSTRTSEASDFMPPKSRADSAGTQYDVTSFINTLSVPERVKATSSLAVSVKPEDDVSEPLSATMSIETSQIVAVERRPSNGRAVTRAYRLEGGVPRKGSADNVVQASKGQVAPSRSQSVDDADLTGKVRVVSPMQDLFGQKSSTAAKAESPRVDFARMPSGRAVGLPARPRMIGHPKRRSSMDESPMAYERPRPAPGPSF